MRDRVTLEIDRQVLAEARELARRRGTSLDRMVEDLLRASCDRARRTRRVEPLPRTARPTTGVKRWSRSALRRRGLEISEGA